MYFLETFVSCIFLLLFYFMGNKIKVDLLFSFKEATNATCLNYCPYRFFIAINRGV